MDLAHCFENLQHKCVNTGVDTGAGMGTGGHGPGDLAGPDASMGGSHTGVAAPVLLPV